MKPESILPPDKEHLGEGVQSLARMISAFFLALRIAIVLMLVGLVFGGMFYVKQQEEAMLFHFGKLAVKDGQEVLRSGTWYWALPYPIDVVKRVPAQKSVTILTKQFWPKEDPNKLVDPKAPPPPPPPPGSPGSGLRPGEDGYLITADANIIHMIWTVTYRVTDAKRYYLNFFDDADAKREAGAKPGVTVKKRGVESLIESLLANAVLREVATWSVEDVLVLSRTTGAADDAAGKRENLTNAVRRRLVDTVEKLDLGIEVQQVSRLEVQPPVSTQQAFREVNAAGADRQMEIDKAVAYERRVVPEAEGKATKILADARAYQTRIVESVKASASYFDKVLEEYRKNPDTMLMSLHADAVRDVLKQAETKYVIHAKGNGAQEVRLMLGPEPEKPGASAAGAAPVVK